MAAAGIAVPVIFDRSFNLQGNTLDKFESIPGLKTSFSLHEINQQLLKVGGVIASFPDEIAKANKKKHVLGDTLSAKNDPSLIQDFILYQKKISGVQGIVFDVKVGEGSSFKTLEEARNLISSLKKFCNQIKITPSFLLSNMDQPLGEAIGNSLEVWEAIKVFKGNGPLDVLKLALEIGSEMLLMAKRVLIKTEAKIYLKRIVKESKPLEKLKEIIRAQGGNPLVVDNCSLLPLAKVRKKVRSLKKGYIHQIKMRQMALLCNELAGCGVESGMKMDRETGFFIRKKIGDRIKKEEALAEVYLKDISLFPMIQEKLREAFVISEGPPDFKPFVIERIGLGHKVFT